MDTLVVPVAWGESGGPSEGAPEQTTSDVGFAHDVARVVHRRTDSDGVDFEFGGAAGNIDVGDRESLILYPRRTGDEGVCSSV